MISIRPAVLADLPEITAIYNEAISHTTATFDTEPKMVEEQAAWFKSHDENHPVMVAVITGQVVGWASLSRWSDRCAYDGTVELSVYVHHGHRGKGIGRKLMEVILAEGEKTGLHTIISRITTENRNSIHLHEWFGFNSIGIMREVGNKFGKLLDVQLMQKMLRKEPLTA